MSLASIRHWLEMHQRRLRVGDELPGIKEIADRCGISRQSLYNVIWNKRTEFSEVIQRRLSRVIHEIDAQGGANKTNLMRISVGSGNSPVRLLVGRQYT